MQTGDVIDRGNRARGNGPVNPPEKEAEAAGGQVVPLLGNHEVMNILATCAMSPLKLTRSSRIGNPKRRRRLSGLCGLVREPYEVAESDQQTVLPATEEEWMAKHPAGFLEYREALDLAGVYGNWVRQHAAVVKIEVIFLPAAPSPNLISPS